jgi:IS605 OrfB family transposase
MKQVLTLVTRIQLTSEQSYQLDRTLQAFADACNYVNDNTNPKLTNKIALQSLTYQTIKENYSLVANMAVRACARVAANRKTAKQKGRPVKKFAATSMDLDKDLFRFIEKDWSVSLSTIEGRLKCRLRVSNYHRGKLAGTKPTSAQLCKHRDGFYYLHFQVKDEAPEPTKASNVIGVDFGRRDIAVTSEGESFSGEQVTTVRDKFSRVRTSVQQRASKGTRSSRRRCRQLLQRLSGKERRFQSWVNHTVSHRIVNQAVKLDAAIAIEDLTGIRERTNQQPRNKTERRRSNSWAFYQLRSFLEYKAIRAGVEVIPIPPAYTSQTCNQCLHIGLRSGKVFKCGHCGWHGDADYNGALNIKLWGRSVILPRGSEILSCSLSKHVLRAAESSVHTA